jgi:SAM-dependent methyltransferase
MPETQTLAAADLAAALDVAPDVVGPLPHDFRHARLTGAERDAVVLRVLRTIADGPGAVAGPARQTRWESGWRENLDAVRRDGFDLARLAPRYFRPDVVRWNGDYVAPERAAFEHDLFAVLRRVVFARWCADAARVVELGCGTGANLVALTEQYPTVEAVGADWTEASQALLAEAARATGRALRGVRFDMFHPARAALPIDRAAVVLTVHALEQLGTGFRPLLDWLLARRPRRVVHVEPIVELYDDGLLLDALARDYHRRRGYLDGYLPALERLAAEGAIRLHVARRVRFGSLFHEAYSLVVWEPEPRA